MEFTVSTVNTLKHTQALIELMILYPIKREENLIHHNILEMVTFIGG